MAIHPMGGLIAALLPVLALAAPGPVDLAPSRDRFPVPPEAIGHVFDPEDTLTVDAVERMDDSALTRLPADRILRRPALLPGWPEEMDAIFAEALAKDPAKRPHDVEQWATAIADVLEKVPAEGPRWTARQGVKRSAQDEKTVTRAGRVVAPRAI